MVDTGKDKTKDGAYQFMRYFAEASSQARWSMATGYIPVRRTTLDIPEYKQYIEDHPQALVPLDQAMHASPDPVDPTGGKIFDALAIAADKVEIENVPAADALNEAARFYFHFHLLSDVARILMLQSTFHCSTWRKSDTLQYNGMHPL